MTRELAAVALALLMAPAARAEERRPWPEVVQLLGGGGTHLGVRLDDVESDDVARLKLKDPRGALVTSVEDGSPAADAGLRRNDVIVTFDGENVRSAATLARLVRETPAGRTVRIEVSRDGARQTVTAELRERGRRESDLIVPTDPPALLRDLPRSFPRLGEPAPRRLGIGYRDVAGEEATRLKLPRAEGVLVTSVEPGSAAETAGLRVDDVIIAVDGNTVRTGAELRRQLRGFGGSLVVAVVRGGETRDITVSFGGESSEGPKKM